MFLSLGVSSNKYVTEVTPDGSTNSTNYPQYLGNETKFFTIIH